MPKRALAHKASLWNQSSARTAAVMMASVKKHRRLVPALCRTRVFVIPWCRQSSQWTPVLLFGRRTNTSRTAVNGLRGSKAAGPARRGTSRRVRLPWISVGCGSIVLIRLRPPSMRTAKTRRLLAGGANGPTGRSMTTRRRRWMVRPRSADRAIRHG